MAICTHTRGHIEACNSCFNNLRAENTRLREQVEDERKHRLQHIELQLKAERERDALQARVEEAERALAAARRREKTHTKDHYEARALVGIGVARGVTTPTQVDRGWHTHDCWRLWDNTALHQWFKCPAGCTVARAAIEEKEKEK